jgi:hypothetical protein
MSKRDLADIEAPETVPLADHPRPERTYAAMLPYSGAVARGEGANLLPWRGKLYTSACLDLRGLDGGRNAGSKRLSNIPERAAVVLMKLGTARAALFGFDPDQCPQPFIAPVRLQGTSDHPHLDQPISSTRRLPMGSLEPVRGLP